LFAQSSQRCAERPILCSAAFGGLAAIDGIEFVEDRIDGCVVLAQADRLPAVDYLGK
jgi:hypothetical protein